MTLDNTGRLAIQEDVSGVSNEVAVAVRLKGVESVLVL